MIRGVEAILALGLATGAHLAAFAYLPQSLSGGSSGANGAAEVILQSASIELAALVDTWTESPEVTGEPPAMATPAADAVPDVQNATGPPDLPTKVAALQSAPAEALPEIQPLAPRTNVALPDLPLMAAPKLATDARPNRLAIRKPETPALPNQMAQPTLDQPPSAETESAQLPGPRSLRPVVRPAHIAAKAPKPKKAQQSEARPAQRAKGAGSTQVRTTGKTAAKAQGLSKSQLRSLQLNWLRGASAKIQRNIRKPNIKETQTPGKIRVTISKSGRLVGVVLARSSGDARRDRAVLSGVKRSGRFKPAPKELTAPEYTFQLSFR